MPLSATEAAQTLDEIARTQRRSAEAHEYASASPQCLLWGLIWMVGYTASHFLPNYGFQGYINWLWFGLSWVGVIGSVVIGRRQARYRDPAEQAADRAKGFRVGMSCFAVWWFLVVLFVVMRPVHPVAVGAIVPLMVALAYSIFGIWLGLRFLTIGVALAALTLGGFLYLREFFLLWMALVGGGSLILVGFWLKRV